MKRGERRLYRELAEAAHIVAESRNYAEEYMAKRRLVRASTALGQAHPIFGRGNPSWFTTSDR